MGESRRGHVVHFTTVHPPGDTRIFHKEVRTLADAGYRVTLVAPGSAPPGLGAVEFVSLPLRPSRRERFAKGTLDAGRALGALDADLYHFHDPELLPLGAWLRLKGRRVVYDAHESVRDSVGAKAYLNASLARIAAAVAGGIEQAVGRRLAHVVTATPTISAQFPFPATVIANYPLLEEWHGIETAAGSYPARPAQGAYVGVITDDRCRAELVAAAALVELRRPGFRFVFAGMVDSPAGAPQGPGVDYVGQLCRAELAGLLSQCRFGVVMMKPLPNNVAGMPTKFLEYLAAGLPVIVSRSLREPVRITESERCGIVVDDDDVAGIAAAMIAMVDDPDAAYQMGDRGRRAVLGGYSWASEGEKLLALYEDLLAVRAPGARAAT